MVINITPGAFLVFLLNYSPIIFAQNTTHTQLAPETNGQVTTQPSIAEDVMLIR